MKKAIFVAVVSALSVSYASASVCVSLSQNLSKGSENSDVAKLQVFLALQKYLTVFPNGYFGPSTIKAVTAFQKANRLPQVGFVGPATRAKIKEISCNSNTSYNTALPSSSQETINSYLANLSPTLPDYKNKTEKALMDAGVTLSPFTLSIPQGIPGNGTDYVSHLTQEYFIDTVFIPSDKDPDPLAGYSKYGIYVGMIGRPERKGGIFSMTNMQCAPGMEVLNRAKVDVCKNPSTVSEGQLDLNTDKQTAYAKNFFDVKGTGKISGDISITFPDTASTKSYAVIFKNITFEAK